MVFALPAPEAGAPSLASARHPEISSSRASKSHTAQTGKASVLASQSKGAAISTLSVSGSKRAPQLLPPPARRANHPSAASLRPARRRNHQAAANQLNCRAKINGKPTTARPTVSVLARVRRISGGDAANRYQITSTSSPGRTVRLKGN